MTYQTIVYLDNNPCYKIDELQANNSEDAFNKSLKLIPPFYVLERFGQKAEVMVFIKRTETK